MALFPKGKLPIANVRRFVIIFYIVGTLGFLIPYTQCIFKLLTPLALIISTYLLLLYHNSYSLKDVLVFLAIYLLGFFIEVVGVATGLVFGSYTYGNALGLAVLGTPLLIGVNWLFLAYACTSLAKWITPNRWLVALVAPSLMVGYDLVLEQVAPVMDMWSWQGGVIPLQNYIAWWVIGFAFCGMLNYFRVDTKNPLAATLVIVQFVFFALLALFMI